MPAVAARQRHQMRGVARPLAARAIEIGLAIEVELLHQQRRPPAARQGAPFRALPPGAPAPPPGALALSGPHQQQNAALALRVVETLQPILPVPPGASARGLATVQWAGRLQALTLPGGQSVLLDGAHNPAGVAALTQVLRRAPPPRGRVFIVGIMRDKDWPAMCRQLLPLARLILFIPVGSDRTLSPEIAVAWCRAQHPQVACAAAASLPAALRQAPAGAEVVITGSLYLIGEALAWLSPEFQSVAAEYALNEWGGHSARPQEALPCHP